MLRSAICRYVRLSCSGRTVAVMLLIVVGFACLLVYNKSGQQDVTSQLDTTCCSSSTQQCSVSTYSLGGSTVAKTRQFVFDTDYLTSLGVPINDSALSTFTDRKITVRDVVFVTAADIWFFDIDMDAVGLVQRHFPLQTIIFYDLSPDARSQSQVNKIRRLCNVEYRAFSFSRYPAHVSKLVNYAWKPIIIHEVLTSHDVVFWIDSSIRFRSGDLVAALDRADTNGGLVMFDFSGHSIFAATHAGLYDYLPINKTLAINSGMWGACAILVYRNKRLYDDVLRWWLLCALTVNCIAPTMDRSCRWPSDGNRNSHYAECHRFDQSAISVLLVHYFNTWWREPVRSTTLNSLHRPDNITARSSSSSSPQNALAFYIGNAPLRVERGSKHKEQISVCDDDHDPMAHSKPVVEYF